ncbi:MAG: hypothetical protein LBJ31_07970 [Treponema sp.]|jgi:hypothetical protein|nr:hypothetical protein [Treponema sp.]
MKKKLLVSVLFVVLAGFAYSQTSPFEGTWTGKITPALFFDAMEYTFKGNTWVLQKFKSGKVAEISEGTFTYSKDRIIMLTTRYKSTGEWKDGGGMTTGGEYVINGNTLTIAGMQLTRKTGSQENTSSSTPDRIGGLYYSMTLPKGWVQTIDNKYLGSLVRAMGIDDAQGDVGYQVYEDSKDDDNFLLIVEMAVPFGYTTERLMADSGSSAQKKVYNGKEYLVLAEPVNSLSTNKAAYIVYKDVFCTFVFILKNNNLYLADQSLNTVTWR